MHYLPNALPPYPHPRIYFLFLSLWRRPCHLPESHRFKISVLRIRAKTWRCVAGMGESLLSGRSCRRRADNGHVEREQDNSGSPSLSISPWVFFVVLGVVANVFPFFLLGFIFKTVPLSPDSSHSTSNQSCSEHLPGDKGRRLRCLRSIRCPWTVLPDVVMLMTVPF